MKDSLVSIIIFLLGCLAGWAGLIDLDRLGDIGKDVPMYILYLLIFLVGVSMGCNPEIKKIIKSVSPVTMLLPAGTIIGTLLFSAVVSPLISGWSLADCLAVGSGMGYYSLSSVLIAQYKEASIGAQMAAELGTIALLTNIFRELITLTSVPLLNRWFGPFAPVASAGVTSFDVCLPVILRCGGEKILPAAIVNGVVTDFSVPFLVSFFCSF